MLLLSIRLLRSLINTSSFDFIKTPRVTLQLNTFYSIQNEQVLIKNKSFCQQHETMKCGTQERLSLLPAYRDLTKHWHISFEHLVSFVSKTLTFLQRTTTTFVSRLNNHYFAFLYLIQPTKYD